MLLRNILHKGKKCYKTKGFTLAEIAVTLFILTIFGTIIIGFSREQERIRDLRRVAETLVFNLRQTQQSALLLTPLRVPQINKRICGWGIYFENNRYIIFTDLLAFNQPCPGNNTLDLGEEQNRIEFPKGISIIEREINSVIFIPPTPDTKFQPTDLQDQEEVEIILTTTNPDLARFKIIINRAGMISKRIIAP